MKKFKFYGVDNNCYKLDNTVWEAREDPSDGYRSYLDSIERKTDTLDLIFFPDALGTVKVESFDNGNQKGWQLIDIQDGHIWLFVGTDYSDGYYPCFRFEYTPRNPNHYNKDGSLKSEWERFFLDED